MSNTHHVLMRELDEFDPAILPCYPSEAALLARPELEEIPRLVGHSGTSVTDSSIATRSGR